jgi:hypothetical protein
MNLLEASLNHKNVDCICLCEHWLTVDQMNITRLPGFNTISSFTRISHIHGRVLQMVKNNVDCRSLTWLANLSVEKDCELSGIYFPTLNLVVIMVYRSPSGDFSTFLLIVNNLLDKLQNNNYNIVVGGDFNVHFNNGNADNNTGLLNDLLNSYGLCSLVTFPTRVETTLDNVFTNIQSDYPLAVQPLDLAISDHIGILLNWSINIPDSKPTLKTIRPITNYGKFLFYHLISNTSWDFIDSDIDPDDKFTMFLNNIVFNLPYSFSGTTACAL